MSTFTIIRDKQKLNNGLTQLKKLQDKYHAQLHVMAVSVLVFANENGRCEPLNRFYSMLSANNQTALKNYIRRFQEKKEADGKVVKTELAFVKFIPTEKLFAIDTSTPTTNRGYKGTPFAEHAEKVLINPDGKNSKPFWEQDNMKDLQLFDDKNIVDGLARMLSTITNGDTENRKVMVSDEYTALLQEAVNKANALKDKLKVEEKHKSNVVALKDYQPATETEAETETETKPETKDEKPANGRRRANQAAKKQATG